MTLSTLAGYPSRNKLPNAVVIHLNLGLVQNARETETGQATGVLLCSFAELLLSNVN